MNEIKGIIYSVLIDFFEIHIPQQEFMKLKKLQEPEFNILKEAWVMSNHYPLDYFRYFEKIFFIDAGKHLAGRMMGQYFNIYMNTEPEKFLKNFVLIFPQIWGLGKIEYHIHKEAAEFMITAGDVIDNFRQFFKAFFENIILLAGGQQVTINEPVKADSPQILSYECLWKVKPEHE